MAQSKTLCVRFLCVWLQLRVLHLSNYFFFPTLFLQSPFIRIHCGKTVPLKLSISHTVSYKLCPFQIPFSFHLGLVRFHLSQSVRLLGENSINSHRFNFRSIYIQRNCVFCPDAQKRMCKVKGKL